MGKKISKNKKSFNKCENIAISKVENNEVKLITFDNKNRDYQDKIANFNKDNIINICFTGETGVGCQSLVRSILGLPFESALPCMNGWQLTLLFLINDKKEYLIYLWNGAGQEKYRVYQNIS